MTPRAAAALWLARIARLLLAAYLIVAAVVLVRSTVLQPMSDQLDWILRWRELRADHDWLSYLLTPHNQHRLVWTLALQALDLEAFGGSNIPLVATGVVGLAVMTWLLAREAASAAGPALKFPAVALAAMLMLNAANLMDAGLPIYVASVHGAVFATAAILLAERAPSRSAPGWRRAGALACAVAAGLGNAAALAVWPVLAWSALRRRDWIWLATVGLCGGAFVVFYLHGQATAQGSGLQAAVADPVTAARISLGYLLLPWTRLAGPFAWIPGLVVFAVAAAAILLRGGPDATPTERAACSLILLTLGTAAMAGLGRSDLLDPANVPVRYSVFVAPMQVGLLTLALPRSETLWRAHPRPVQAAIVAGLGLMLLQNVVMGGRAIATAARIRAHVAEFQAGRIGPDASVLVHPQLDFARRIYEGLRRDGLFRRQLGAAKEGDQPVKEIER